MYKKTPLETERVDVREEILMILGVQLMCHTEAGDHGKTELLIFQPSWNMP